MPELDMPGHAQSWCVGYPEICPSKECKSPLNPATDATWNLIKGLMGEFTGDGDSNFENRKYRISKMSEPNNLFKSKMENDIPDLERKKVIRQTSSIMTNVDKIYFFHY